MVYFADDKRYGSMHYNRCGNSGIKLPALSLGLWHNFGSVDDYSNGKKILHKAFDAGITHFDLANNYGPTYGTAEVTFGKVLKEGFRSYRDEMIISTKAGYDMWPGPYGNFGSRKYLIASVDQSLMRMGLDYVDIFYHHRPDPHTPMEETMGALDQIIRSGKALYAGVSNYSPGDTLRAYHLLKETKTPFIIHQPKYSMFVRDCENELFDVLAQCGLGGIVFSPLAQGLLSGKYNQGIPAGSRASKFNMAKDLVTPENVSKVQRLVAVADQRGQSLVQLALSWTLRNPQVTSALIGVSSVEQLSENLGALNNLNFSEKELRTIDSILLS